AMRVKPGNRAEPAIRQLKCPCTDPSAIFEAWNPNCENGFTPSTVPRPPPLTLVGASPTAAGDIAAAARSTASSTRLMRLPFPRVRSEGPARPSPECASNPRDIQPLPQRGLSLPRNGENVSHLQAKCQVQQDHLSLTKHHELLISMHKWGVPLDPHRSGSQLHLWRPTS